MGGRQDSSSNKSDTDNWTDCTTMFGYYHAMGKPLVTMNDYMPGISGWVPKKWKTLGIPKQIVAAVAKR